MLESEPEAGDVDTRLDCAQNLDHRLLVVQNMGDKLPSTATPEIRLELDEQSPTDTPLRRKVPPKILAPSKSYPGLHDKHASVLLRLLFIHSSINPGNISPHIPALLVPIYSVMTQEIEPEDVAHIEADTFWVFTALINDFSELEDEEGGNIWMKKLGDRLAWADQDLSDNLVTKSSPLQRTLY